MSTLRSVCDELRIRDLRVVSDDELASYLDDLERTDRFVDAERARALAELERREVFARDGHLSLASWMVARHGVGPSTAAGHVRMARALEQMPVAADALASGEVSSAAVSLLASAQEMAPKQFAHSEETLVDAARALPVTPYPVAHPINASGRKGITPRRGVVGHCRSMNDEELLAQAEEALTEIKVNQGLSDRHASVLAALRIRLKGSAGKSLEEMLQAAGDLESDRLSEELAKAETKKKPSLDDLLAKPEKKRDWPSG